jgi:uncharacterized protein YukJ
MLFTICLLEGFALKFFQGEVWDMSKYCLLKGKPLAYDNHSDDNHIYIRTIARNTNYAIAVNVCSNISPHRMWYAIKKFDMGGFKYDSVKKRILTNIYNRSDGLLMIQPSTGLNLSYYQRWFDRSELKLASERRDPNNELGRELIRLTKTAMREKDASVCAYGICWGPKNTPEKVFGFYPGLGVHDVHCNIENGHDSSKIRPSTAHDGALFYIFPSRKLIYGVFCLFPNQM